jgi:hypothetical protein
MDIFAPSNSNMDFLAAAEKLKNVIDMTFLITLFLSLLLSPP